MPKRLRNRRAERPDLLIYLVERPVDALEDTRKRVADDHHPEPDQKHTEPGSDKENDPRPISGFGQRKSPRSLSR